MAVAPPNCLDAEPVHLVGSEPEIYRRGNLKHGRGHVIAVAEVDIIEVDRVGHHRGRVRSP